MASNHAVFPFSDCDATKKKTADSNILNPTMTSEYGCVIYRINFYCIENFWVNARLFCTVAEWVCWSHVRPSSRLTWHLSPSGIRVPSWFIYSLSGTYCMCVCTCEFSYSLQTHQHSGFPHSAWGTYDQTELNATIAPIKHTTMSLGGVAFISSLHRLLYYR